MQVADGRPYAVEAFAQFFQRQDSGIEITGRVAREDSAQPSPVFVEHGLHCRLDIRGFYRGIVRQRCYIQ
jgi:hypothetical protein